MNDLSVARPANAAPRLERVAFKTSRFLDFVGERELTAQIGHPPPEWPLVILKELTDNALDGCEADTAPVIAIDLSSVKGTITITDNGPGIAGKTIADILDYRVRVSSREAYVSPTRGAQGNALKTILAMGFALSGEQGETVIESRGTAHRIVFAAARIRQEPRIQHTTTRSLIKNGTSITVHWPDSACSILREARAHFLQIADDFGWFNPHLSLSLSWDGETHAFPPPSDPAWQKWRPSNPTSAHWYDRTRLERYVAAHLSSDQDQKRHRLVREFITEFRGLSGTQKQKLVLDDLDAARVSLAEFASNGSDLDHAAMDRLLAALQRHTRPPKPKDLGVIGREHLLARFLAYGAHADTFKYKAVIGDTENGLPVVIETAFSWCPNGSERRIITGVNFSVALGNPFRSFGQTGEGLEYLLAQQRAGRHEPIIFVLHLASPRVEFADRGKTALVIAERRA